MSLLPKGMPLDKRLLDLFLILISAPLTLPVLLILGLLTLIFHGAPILFTQVRPGYKGKPFKMYKLRSMTNARDPQGNLLPDESRLTRFGRFIRASSLDELPELLNVLRGEMSLVGPRPLLMQYLSRYSPEQARRHEVYPGISGWAQINGRNNLSWQDKFELDVWYVDHRSLALDVKIILRTLLKVIQREGISEPGNATAREFMGNEGQE